MVDLIRLLARILKTFRFPASAGAFWGLFLVVNTFSLSAQNITNYTFLSSSGTFTALTGATATTWSGTTNEGGTDLIPIGFDFWYMGARYTEVAAGTNGWLALGAVQTNYSSSNSLTSGGAPRPVIAPLWDDLNIGATSNVTYKTTGTTGSRVFTVQYLNVRWGYQASGGVISFQVKLYETTGKIEFVYKSESVSTNNPSASIGITATATGSGKFLSVNNSGSNVSSTNESNVTSKPGNGKTYSFTPPVPTAPSSLTFSGVGASAMTLNWTDNSSNETAFLLYRSTDGTNYTFVGQVSANTTSSAQTGLASGTTYYWRVYALSEGALSTVLSGSQATCTPPAAPTVTTPVLYCQNATAAQLSAAGSNLLWGGEPGTVGGTSALTTTAYVDATFNNKKTNFTTNVANLTLQTVDYYIPANQSVSGLVLSVYNASGAVIATSSTNTTQSAGASAVKVTATFNYVLTAVGNYSIGVSAGTGNIGSDSPSFPLTESSNSISITGVSNAGIRCYNNLQFARSTSATAPTPSTIHAGSTIYSVTQTVSGCVSPAASITVTVDPAPDLSSLSDSLLIAYYRFEGNANDATGNNQGTLQNTPSATTDRFGNSASAYNFNGSSQYVSTAKLYATPGPQEFTVSIWFKTATTTGGKLIGFGFSQTGSSSQYDRHLYMNNAGQIYFGVYPTVVKTVNSSLSYNDNNWHLATGTLSATTGMKLYIDGVQVAADPAVVSAENFSGYWRIAYDNINGWTSQPSTYYFNGVLDDAIIYHRALSASEVLALYTAPDGAGNTGPGCLGSGIGLTATTVAGAAYSWTGPDGFTSSVQNPTFTLTPAKVGVYTLLATLGGCTTTAYTNVTASTDSGEWTGDVSTDWADADNWCSGVVPGGSTNVVIPTGAARMPVISGSAACNNLTIQAGASLTTGAAGTLGIAGTLANSGTMTNSGTTQFNGTSGQQTFSGVTVFYNVILNNTAGLLLPNDITVHHLTLTAGTLNANNFNISVTGNWTNNVSTAALTAGEGTVTFNGSAAQTIGGTFATTFNNLTIGNSGSGVTLAANANVAGNLVVSSTTFDLDAYTANRTTTGGSLSVANNSVLKIGGTGTFPANYSTISLPAASTVHYAGTSQTVANQPYGTLRLSSSAGAAVKTFPGTALVIMGNLISEQGAGASVTFTAASNIMVASDVTIGASTTFNGGSYAHIFAGNWTNEGTFNGNTGTVTFTDPESTVGGSGTHNFNNLTVAASGITFSNSTITLSGNLATTGSGAFSQASGGTLSMTGTGKTISGAGIVLDNLTISGSISTGASFVMTGNLSVSGSFTASAGSVTMAGASKTISGSGTKSFSSLSVLGAITTDADFSISSGLSVNGSFAASAGTATFTGTSTLSGTASLYNVTLNGTSLQLAADAELGISNVFTITAGTLDVTTSLPNTVNFNGTGAQTVNAITYHYLVLSNGNTKTAAGAITVAGHFTIGSGTTFDPSTYTHSLHGDWINNGTFLPGSSTITFVGATTSHIWGATTFNVLTSNTTYNTTELILKNDVTAATVNMTKGVVTTKANTLTITGTRTGNGYIFGNIRRLHTFSTGTAYAFEGPNNTITFSTVSGVTSVTVSVEKFSIADFPYSASIGREYTVTVPAGTYDATLRLHYEDEELNGNPESTMSLWQYNGTLWLPVGKTGNSTTDNYVEMSGLTGIAGRWTCGYTPDAVQWNGSVSSDWNTAANWTVVFGSGSTPPSADDVVAIGTATFTYHPQISSAVTVKNVVFGDVKGANLTLATGGSLTSGNILGVWADTARHSIAVNGQSLYVDGDLQMSDGTVGHSIDLNIGSGTVTVTGELAQWADADIVFSGPGTLNIHTHYHYNGGQFIPGNGTVIYSGDENQHVGHVDYHHLTISNTGGNVLIDAPAEVDGDLTLTAGQLDNEAMLTVQGDVSIGSGTILHNTGSLHVGGDWINNGTFEEEGTDVVFDGSGAQQISASNFNNLVIDKPVGSTAILTGHVALNGDLNVSSGTFDIDTFLCNRNVLGGFLTIADSATFIVGANNAPLNFSNGYVAPASTVIADGTVPQAIYGLEFGNLVFRNGGLKTLIAPIVVNGNLVIENGATFDAGSQTLTVNGNWVNNGTFVPSTSMLIFGGSGKSVSGNTTFFDATITGSYTNLANMTYNGVLHITATGSISSGGGIFTTMNGDLVNNGVLYTLGTTTFTGNVLQTLSLMNAVQTVALIVNFNGSVSPVLHSTSSPQFGYLNINNTGGIYPSIGWTVLYSLNIGSGAAFHGGNFTHVFEGAVTNSGTMTSSGVLTFSPASPATVNLGSDFVSTGTVVFGGTGAMTLAGSPDTFHNVLISNTNAAGIAPSSDWAITNELTLDAGAILNAGSHTLAIAGDITNQGTINAGTSTFLLNGDEQQDISSESALYNLTVDKSASNVRLLSNLTVNGNLHFAAGMINTGTYMVVMPASGTVTGAGQSTGWVNGGLQKGISTGATVKTFETGDENYYSPFTLNFASVTTAGNLIAKSFSGDHPAIGSSPINEQKSVNRYWCLLDGGVDFTTYSITLKYPAASLDAGATPGMFGAALHTGSTWLTPVSGIGTDTSITASGVVAFGEFAVGEICNGGTTISYGAAAFCTSEDSVEVILTGTTGGAFSSSTGLSIHPASGRILLDASDPGMYSVVYTVNASGECPVFITSTEITVDEAPMAEGSYTGDPFCSNEGVIYPTGSGTGGGTFSGTAGLVIDAQTAAIDLAASTPGTHTVTYTIAASGGCPEFSWTTDVHINTAPSAAISYANAPFCSNAGLEPVIHTGTSGGTYAGTAGLDINSTTGQIDVSASTIGTYAVTYTLAAQGGCPEYIANTEIDILYPGTWSGQESTSWTDSGNWLCGAIPTGATDVTIPADMPYSPVLNSGTGAVRNLTVDNGATFTVASGATLQIAGDISNAGTISAADATIEMNGSGAQTIPAGAFSGNTLEGLTIDNTAGVTLQGALSLTDVLTVSAGSLHTGGYLTLKSTATGTARVAEITSAASSPIDGPVLVERYIPGRRRYRLITSSTTTSPSASLNTGEEAMSIWGNWQNQGDNVTANTGTIITGGNSADGFDPQTGNPSLFTYDDVNRVYVPFSSANGKNTKYTPLKAGTAYYMFVYGDRVNSVITPTPNNTVLKSYGTLLTGDQEYDTGSPVPLSGVTGRFTLLGNPFASPIDWASLPRTNLANTYWGWDPNLNNLGGYVTVSVLGNVVISSPYSGSTGLNQYIQPGQGFFVKTTAASPALSIREQDKAANFNGSAFLTGPAEDRDPLSLLAVNLLYPGSNGPVMADGVVAVFGDAFTAPAGDEDAEKLGNLTETVSIQNGGKRLSIDARPLPQEKDTLYLNWSKITKVKYTLQVFMQDMEATGVQPYLVDNYLHTSQMLPVSDTSLIEIQANPADPASVAADRFRIVFASDILPADPGAGREERYLRVFPNPVSGRRLGLQIADPDAGAHTVRLVNVQGQEVMVRTVDHPGGLHRTTLHLDEGIAAGTYFLHHLSAAGRDVQALVIE